MTAILLIHGAWHGAWAWDAVLPYLDGHSVFAPDLPGCGGDADRLSPDIGLEDHVAAVLPDRPVVIGAHSYGGVVARVIADRVPRMVAGIVLIEALWPDDGQSALDTASPEQAAKLTGAIEGPGKGWMLPPANPMQFDLPDPSLAPDLARRMTPHPARTFRDPVRVRGDGPVGAYLMATDRPGHPYQSTADRLANRGWTISRSPGGHELPFTQPRRVAELLIAASNHGKDTSCVAN